ncbi:MAG: ATP-binding protein [Phycisphaerae bacterium]
MDSSLFDDMKAYVGFTEEDATMLRGLGSEALNVRDDVVERFYKELLQHPRAKAIFRGDRKQMAALHGTLRVWLAELFVGKYGEAYFEKRSEIGAAHVQVGLPQDLMVLGMELVRRELTAALKRSVAGWNERLDQAVCKILALDLAVMAQSYQSISADRIRRTVRAHMEEQLTQAQHLARIGQLAASLAHEIKNPLAGISGAIQVIEDSLDKDDPHRPIIGEILTQIGRLDATVKDLLLYARPTPPTIRSVHLYRLVKRTRTLLQAEPALKDIEIEIKSAPELPPIEADEDKLEQLLLNLLLNSAHATSDGATITVELGANDDHVTLRVIDRGTGMSQEVQQRALDPFFTTKAKGTGLGLAICRRIAETHGGSIDLQSEAGAGTTVTIALPRVFSTAQ